MKSLLYFLLFQLLNNKIDNYENYFVHYQVFIITQILFVLPLKQLSDDSKTIIERNYCESNYWFHFKLRCVSCHSHVVVIVLLIGLLRVKKAGLI